MSTNLIINRRCDYCHNEFEAKTTVTRYCSKACNDLSYKARLRAVKVQKSYAETVEKATALKASLLNKDLLTVNDVCKILEFGRSSVYRLLASGELKSYVLSERGTRIKPTDLLSYVEKKGEEKFARPQKVSENGEEKPLEIGNCYGVRELVIMFGKQQSTLYTYLKRAGIPKITNGREVYFSKTEIDKLYRKFTGPKQVGHDKERAANLKLAQKGIRISDCYTMEQCVTMFGAKRSNLYGIFSRRKVPKIQDGHIVYYSKKAVEKIFNSNGKGGTV